MLLYLHVPFCVRKCAYCAFHSGPYRIEDAVLYTELVLKEMAARAEDCGRARIETVYFGGGTPSLLEFSQISAILNGVARFFNVADDAEITVEANPESVVHPGFLAGLLSLGVNRLSLGVQSFHNHILRTLCRAHDSQGALRAIHAAKNAGFENIGLDLMWGLPGQNLTDWMEDLRQAVALGPEHLSCYGLSLEDGTDLTRRVRSGILRLPEEDESALMYLHGSEFLESSGYGHYEISNYARPGRESRHNTGYWTGQDYLGLGPSAVSCLAHRRWTNAVTLADYAQCVDTGCPVMNVEELTEQMLRQELIMLSLRRSAGLDLEKITAMTGQDFSRFLEPGVEQLCSSGLTRLRSGHLQPTRKGMLVSNALIEFVLDLLEGMPKDNP